MLFYFIFLGFLRTFNFYNLITCSAAFASQLLHNCSGEWEPGNNMAQKCEEAEMKLADLLICHHPFSPGWGYQAGPVVRTLVLFLGLSLAYHLTCWGLRCPLHLPSPFQADFWLLSFKILWSGAIIDFLSEKPVAVTGQQLEDEEKPNKSHEVEKKLHFCRFKNPGACSWPGVVIWANSCEKYLFFWTMVWMERLWLYHKNRQEEPSL